MTIAFIIGSTLLSREFILVWRENSNNQNIFSLRISKNIIYTHIVKHYHDFHCSVVVQSCNLQNNMIRLTHVCQDFPPWWTKNPVKISKNIFPFYSNQYSNCLNISLIFKPGSIWCLNGKTFKWLKGVKIAKIKLLFNCVCIRIWVIHEYAKKLAVGWNPKKMSFRHYICYY